MPPQWREFVLDVEENGCDRAGGGIQTAPPVREKRRENSNAVFKESDSPWGNLHRGSAVDLFRDHTAF